MGCADRYEPREGKAARTAAIQSGLRPQKSNGGPTLVGPYKSVAMSCLPELWCASA